MACVWIDDQFGFGYRLRQSEGVDGRHHNVVAPIHDQKWKAASSQAGKIADIAIGQAPLLNSLALGLHRLIRGSRIQVDPALRGARQELRRRRLAFF